MGFKEYLAVSQSTWYDSSGSRKAVLARIAALIRVNPPFKGWCTAGQEHLSRSTGFSVATVQRAVAEFKRDGVVRIKCYRDPESGHEYNHYWLYLDQVEAKRRPKKTAFAVSDPDEGTVSTDRSADQSADHSQKPDFDEGQSRSEQQDEVWPDLMLDEGAPHGEVEGLYRKGSKHTGLALEHLHDSQIAREQVSRGSSRDELGGSAPPAAGYAPSPLGRGSAPTAPGHDLIVPPPAAAPGSADHLRSKALEHVGAKYAAIATANRGMQPPPPISREESEAQDRKRVRKPESAYRVADDLVKATMASDLDLYLRAFSLALQLYGYIESRQEDGERVYALNTWSTLFTADFITALRGRWKFEDLEDAIDVSQTTRIRSRFVVHRRFLKHCPK